MFFAFLIGVHLSEIIAPIRVVRVEQMFANFDLIAEVDIYTPFVVCAIGGQLWSSNGRSWCIYRERGEVRSIMDLVLGE